MSGSTLTDWVSGCVQRGGRVLSSALTGLSYVPAGSLSTDTPPERVFLNAQVVALTKVVYQICLFQGFGSSVGFSAE